MPAAGWPDPAQNGNDLDMIPGMATETAVQPYGVTGADPYHPATNQTLIVSASEAPYGTMARESRLQRLLFSRRLAYLAAGLAVVLVFGLLGWWMIEGRYTIVPKVTGVSAATAQADLRDVGLTPGATTTVLDNTVAKGLVIRTSPANGSRIARGGRVGLVVSAGPHMIDMPQVTGQALSDAQAAIKHAGLVPGKVKTVTSTTIPVGIVISTDPTAGTSWPQPKPVSIVLSAGPPLPNFVGQDKSVAEQWTAANGVKLNEVTAAHSDQPVNMVVKQSAPPGSAFTNGEVITIQISPGPPMVNIPECRRAAGSQGGGHPAQRRLRGADQPGRAVQRGVRLQPEGTGPEGQHDHADHGTASLRLSARPCSRAAAGAARVRSARSPGRACAVPSRLRCRPAAPPEARTGRCTRAPRSAAP